MLNKFNLLTGILCSVSLLAISPVHAETLYDVLAYTYENSLDLSAERSGQKATDELVAKEKSGYRPAVQATGNYGRSYGKYHYEELPSTRRYQNPRDVTLSVNQPVFSGLSTYNAVESARKQVKAGQANLLSAEQATLLDATAVYMDVIRDMAVLDLQISNEKVLKKHLQSYRKRFSVGDLTNTDVAQSEARASGATANRIAAEGNLKVSKANFFSVVGMEPENLQDLPDINIALPENLDEAIAVALKQNPQIKAAEYIRQAAEHTVSAKKGALLPSVNVGAQVSRQYENLTIEEADYWQVSAGMTVPIYNTGRDYADIREAKHLENKYRILWAKTCQDVRAETIAAWENYQSTKAQIKSIKDQIKASKIALDGVIREARVGSRTVLDVLDAEQEHLDNQVSLVKVHRDEIVSAFALLSAIGKMNQAGLNLDVKPYDPRDYYEEVKNKWIGYGID
ncbi:MAG: TolC family outer membrane protein [Lactobacillales bacterium]|jgi:outer membrane protein|nr:TolC family outer membrane protein [Lactobacillales bacterium]